ncbi:fam221a [Symbiodinium pilosum]|uniref:Fam221a protein n=1 Tax=Symbiodinium pilosum TaxID=2952 RepID=A0A812R8T2_SYMPI|nr:fam221a [Symbiodinium pilosum]
MTFHPRSSPELCAETRRPGPLPLGNAWLDYACRISEGALPPPDLQKLLKAPSNDAGRLLSTIVTPSTSVFAAEAMRGYERISFPDLGGGPEITVSLPDPACIPHEGLCHPDKVPDREDDFIQLGEALEVLLARPQSATSGCTRSERSERSESERLDKFFFGTHFGSDQFDPRAWLGQAEAESLASGKPFQCVWRCKSCPEASSVCCRLKPKKHSCLCGHKVDAHDPRRRFRCTMPACKCRRLEFYVQQLGWEARCGCKHHLRDHNKSGEPPYRCTKLLPGKDKKPCPCSGFHVAWVCTCGHPWEEHETTWQECTSTAVFSREWVAGGLRPECVAEAEEKRTRWKQEAADVAERHGRDVATKLMADKAKRMQVSMCAEAGMREAIDETLDGTRLPQRSPQPSRLRNSALQSRPCSTRDAALRVVPSRTGIKR